MDTPLQPVSSPFALLSSYHISGMLPAEILLAVVVLFWALYTIVAIYHWMRYSHAALIAMPAIAAHLAVSAMIILFAVSGL